MKLPSFVKYHSPEDQIKIIKGLLIVEKELRTKQTKRVDKQKQRCDTNKVS